jgi:hypothetical protein
VLNADIDTLLEVTVSNWLVNDYAEGRLCDVVDNAGLSVVPLVWETAKIPQSAPNSSVVSQSSRFLDFLPLLDSSIGDNIDDITDAVMGEVGRKADHTLLPEVARVRIASTRSLST